MKTTEIDSLIDLAEKNPAKIFLVKGTGQIDFVECTGEEVGYYARIGFTVKLKTTAP